MIKKNKIYYNILLNVKKKIIKIYSLKIKSNNQKTFMKKIYINKYLDYILLAYE